MLNLCGKKGVILVVFLMTFFLFLFGFGNLEAIGSSLNVINSGPYLVKQIPNQSWGLNENLTQAFFLDNYFEDDSGTNLTYNSSAVENITIAIDSSSAVSFYSDHNFLGNRTVLFYAVNELNLSEPSNIVYLHVGEDNESPQWFDPSLYPSSVSQNDVITFSTKWTDNFGLEGFLLSIDQGSGWNNYSSMSFSGTTNYSNYSLQISAPPGSRVFWRMYAWDGSGNINATSIQQFYVNELGSNPSGSNESGSSTQVFTEILSKLGLEIPKSKSFELNVNSIYMDVLQGQFKSYFFKVKNTGTSSLNFSLSVANPNGVLFLDQYNFSLSPKSEKGILLNAKIPFYFPPGDYSSYILIKADNLTQIIPVFLVVKPSNAEINVDVKIFNESLLVNPGKEVRFLITADQANYVSDLDSELYIALKDMSGNVYNFSQERIALGRIFKLEESLLVPKDALEGQYIIYARIISKTKVGLDAEVFEVGYKFNFSSFLRYGSFILIVFFAALIFVFLAMRYKQGKRRERLLYLYLLLSKLKEKLSKQDVAGAAEIYIKLKQEYGERVPMELIKNKDFLKKELTRLSNVIKSSEQKAVVKDSKKENPKKTEKSQEGGNIKKENSKSKSDFSKKLGEKKKSVIENKKFSSEENKGNLEKEPKLGKGGMKNEK